MINKNLYYEFLIERMKNEQVISICFKKCQIKERYYVGFFNYSYGERFYEITKSIANI